MKSPIPPAQSDGSSLLLFHIERRIRQPSRSRRRHTQNELPESTMGTVPVTGTIFTDQSNQSIAHPSET